MGDGALFARVLVRFRKEYRQAADGIRGALAGRTPAEARAALESQGLHVTDLRLTPSWWPRLPLLDARLSVN